SSRTCGSPASPFSSPTTTPAKLSSWSTAPTSSTRAACSARAPEISSSTTPSAGSSTSATALRCKRFPGRVRRQSFSRSNAPLEHLSKFSSLWYHFSGYREFPVSDPNHTHHASHERQSAHHCHRPSRHCYPSDARICRKESGRLAPRLPQDHRSPRPPQRRAGSAHRRNHPFLCEPHCHRG